jgi:hypothetical protein
MFWMVRVVLTFSENKSCETTTRTSSFSILREPKVVDVNTTHVVKVRLEFKDVKIIIQNYELLI